MIEIIPSEPLQVHVYRMAVAKRISRFLEEQGLDSRSVEETKDFLRAYGMKDSAEEVCDAPFKPKSRLHNVYSKSRFSDGSFPVFYSSQQIQTADAEIQHWFPQQFAGNPKSPRTAYYYRLKCSFRGVIRDLRKMQAAWPDLTHDDDYRFCNELGFEAVNLRLDAFLAPSVRRENGTNVPIFVRESIHDPQVIALVSVTYDPHTKCVSINSQ